MMIIKKIIHCCFVLLYLFCCSSVKSQNDNTIQLIKDGTKLIVKNNKDSIVLNDLLIDESNAYYNTGDDGMIYIIYEYYGSFNKSMVIYSLKANEDNVILNKIIHFNYNDKEGIPFGWMYYCYKKLNSEYVNYDTLTGIKSQMEYNSFHKEKERCDVTILSEISEQKSIAVKKDKLIRITIPLFFSDGCYIGNGSFDYLTDVWSNLSMDFQTSNLKTDYFSFPVEVNIQNVIRFNDIAYYLECGGNYKESQLILEKIIKNFPTRIVAYINLGDAYWGLENYSKAKGAYQKYIELMKANGKESKIPQRISDRVK